MYNVVSVDETVLFCSVLFSSKHTLLLLLFPEHIFKVRTEDAITRLIL